MREISVFDVVGPNMIGPSSSHTAGALRIALMAGKISKGKPKKVKFILYGSFAMTYKGHGTDKALLAGILGMNTEVTASGIPSVWRMKQGLNRICPLY